MPQLLDIFSLSSNWHFKIVRFTASQHQLSAPVTSTINWYSHSIHKAEEVSTKLVISHRGWKQHWPWSAASRYSCTSHGQLCFPSFAIAGWVASGSFLVLRYSGPHPLIPTLPLLQHFYLPLISPLPSFYLYTMNSLCPRHTDECE